MEILSLKSAISVFSELPQYKGKIVTSVNYTDVKLESQFRIFQSLKELVEWVNYQRDTRYSKYYVKEGEIYLYNDDLLGCAIHFLPVFTEEIGYKIRSSK